MQARYEAGLTVEELARLLGVSVRTVNRWQADQRFPGREHLSRLAEELNVSVAYLLGEETVAA